MHFITFTKDSSKQKNNKSFLLKITEIVIKDVTLFQL